jgi:hypothetical protein
LGRQAVDRLIEARRTVAFRGGRPRADCVFLGMPTARPQGTRALPAFLAETIARGAICGGRHADPPAASVRLADHAATGGFVRGLPYRPLHFGVPIARQGACPALVCGELPGRLL